MVDALRLILLGIGLLIIGLIYAWGMRAQIRDRLKTRRQEPGLDSPEVDEPTVDDPGTEMWSAASVRAKPVSAAEPPKTSAPNNPPSAPKAKAPPPAPQPTAPQTPSKPPAAQPKAVSGKPQPSGVPADSAQPTAQQPAASKPAPHKPVTPAAPSSPAQRGTRTAAAPTKPTTPQSQPAAAQVKPWHVILTIIAPERQPYTGQAIKAALEQQQFVLTERGVWECLTGDGSDQMIFSVGHLREPGTFDLAKLAQLRTPGLLLFMVLPGPLNATTAFDLMLEEARQLQRRLGGVLCDQRRHPVSAQSLLQLRTRANHFDHSRS